MIARVGSSRHDRVSSGRYRVLAIRAIYAVADDATPSRSGRGEERQKDSCEEDKQAKQNARIQEGRLIRVSLFHNAGLLRAAPILGSIAKESRDVFLFVFEKSHGCLGAPFSLVERLCPSRLFNRRSVRLCLKRVHERSGFIGHFQQFWPRALIVFTR